MFFVLLIFCFCYVPYEVTSIECPGGGWLPQYCDGCQCCPNGCPCPNAPSNCNTCPKTWAQCQPSTTAGPTTTSTTVTTTTSSQQPQVPTTSTTGGPPNKLILFDDFNTFNLGLWKHEITLGGGGNWEFQAYYNNRSTSYVKNGILYIKPGLTADYFGINGENLVKQGGVLDFWGSTPADLCTGNAFYGCSRGAGGGGNYVNPITSAAIRTAETFSFKYGRVEVRAKMPSGDWLWPAIWMLPKDNSYGNWPASGEIDIVESRGNRGYPAQYGGGPETIGTTLHWGPAFNADPFMKTHKTYSLNSGTFNDNFHTFGLVWTPTRIYSYVDSENNKVLDLPINQDFWTLGNFPPPYENPWRSSINKNAPFDQEFYLIFNVAVGGTSGYFPDGVGGKPWTNHDTHASNNFYNAKSSWYPTWKGEGAALQVDWVKVWSL